MYVTVLDFGEGKVHQFDGASGHSSEDIENFLVKVGFNLGNIEWMLHKDGEVYYN